MEIKQIPLSLVIPSPMNPRKTFDETELQELAGNIESQGLLQPITVRPVKHPSNEYGDRPDKYEIVCGERRFRAFSKLSEKWSEMDAVAPKGQTYNRFSEIPAIVREMTDDEAFDAMITENLQRKDVDPMEEAFAFSQLIQKGKTAEEVALRFGKSIRFVQDRVKLNNLIPELIMAVKDDKMSISAAMIIAKLDEDAQHKFHSQYKNNINISKSTAESFVSNLFMVIEKSLWYQSDDQADENFEGGCGRKCSDCALNTSNHGCLFWEMKSQDAGRCTDREKFNSKTIAYMLREIDAISDSLVKANQPLAFGKTVLCITDYSYDSENVKRIKSLLVPEIVKRGYEIVDPDVAFSHAVSYGTDDERVAEMLKRGEVYRGIKLFEWHGAALNHLHYYKKKNDNNVNSGEDGTPFKVGDILSRLKQEKESLKSAIAVKGAEALATSKTYSTEPLTDDERVLMVSFMLVNNFNIQSAIGLQREYDPINIRNFVSSHPELWASIMHGWICQQVQERHPCLKMAERVLDDLGNLNCPEAYRKAKDNVINKFNKAKEKAEKQLRGLGYGLDGKPLPKGDEIKLPNGINAREQFDEMKKKHPDTLLLFRVNDFYECFNEDAEKVAETLKLTLTTTTKGYKLAGFPHHALDTYLPKLIRAGHKVAVCEQLEKPDKSDKGKKDKK